MMLYGLASYNMHDYDMADGALSLAYSTRTSLEMKYIEIDILILDTLARLRL